MSDSSSSSGRNYLSAANGLGVGYYDEFVARISGMYKRLAASAHGSFGSDKEHGPLVDPYAFVRKLKENNISALIPSTLASSISSSRSRLASAWSVWQVPLALTGPLHKIASCSYSRSVFENFQIKDPREQEKYICASIILGGFICLVLALIQIMGDNYRYNGTTRYGDSSSRLRRSPGLLGDNWFSRHSNHLSRYLGLDPQEERDPIQKEVDRALKYESESRCYQPPYPRYSTKPNLDSAGLPLKDNLNDADHYTNGDSPSIARTGNSDRSAEQFIKLHRNNRVYRIKFPPGTLDNKIVTVADLRHIASRLFKIPFVNCFPIVDHYPVPATDGSENGVDAYTFGWCNGAEGWCYEVRDPLTGGPLSDRGERRWPGTVNLTSIGTGENESIVEVTLEQPSSPPSSTSGKRRNKKGGRKKTSAQGLRSRESESTGSNTVNNNNNNMGTGSSREKAKSGRSHHHVPQETTSAPSGRPQLTTRSLEPPKYNLNAMPHSQVLALLNRYFMEDVKPCMDDYIAAPPTSPKQRDAEYLILNERCERDIILQLDALVCDGDTNMRAQRKALTNAVHQELKKLDEAVIAAGGKKRSG